ncbi:MAG: Biopolymer transport protein ExbD/TolR [uncultured Thiotrichaceae bacterium]|uniref:Biopolymer transport protein ExbD n=1 Tax=uncultured Thiotrichaceae bacterium TaxID=298394 RepID=A0A6S6U3J0_9GAMM|nr:MAG: Biopolymer transport protein ExbD/TolR [uncultured Thiotrichaceae bacterium]
MKPFNQINVIPFIDIMLVLLAIVLLTATFINHQQIDLKLPTADNASAIDKTEEKITITIDPKQQFYFDDLKVEKAELTGKLDTLKPDTSIVLSVDKTVPFEAFITIVDLLKERKLENLSIMVDPSEQ